MQNLIILFLILIINCKLMSQNIQIIPDGEVVTADGQYNEWTNSLALAASGNNVTLYMMKTDDKLNICFKASTGLFGQAEVFIETGTLPTTLHTSAQRGERKYINGSWEAWNWGNNTGWNSNVTTNGGSVYEFSIDRSKLAGDNIKIHFECVLIANGVFEIKYPAGSIGTASGEWLEISLGNTATQVDKVEVPYPDNFNLEDNYPNPFNPNTTINYQLTSISHVRLVVLDLLGREVAVLVNKKKETGKFSVSFSGSNLTSGVYFYKLTAGGFSDIKKMTLIK